MIYDSAFKTFDSYHLAHVRLFLRYRAFSFIMRIFVRVLIAFSLDRLRSFHNFSKIFTFKVPRPVMLKRPSRSDIRESRILSFNKKKLLLIQRLISLRETSSNSSSPTPVKLLENRSGTRMGMTKRTTVIIVILLVFAAFLFTMENAVYYFYLRTHEPNDGTPLYKIRPDWLTSWHSGYGIQDVSCSRCVKLSV